MLLQPRSITYDGFGVFYGTLHGQQTFSEHAADMVEVSVPLGRARGPASLHTAGGKTVTHLIHSEYVSVIPAQQPHWGQWDETADLVVFYLTASYLKNMAERMRVSLDIIEAPTAHDPVLRAIGTAFYAEAQYVENPDVLYVEAVAYVIAKQLLRHYNHRSPSNLSANAPVDSTIFTSAVDHINAHCHRPLTVQQVAQAVGVSETQLRRFFRVRTGYTPQQFITYCRIERAKRLLSETHMPLNQIAAQLGFSDQAHLSRQFRQHVGGTPSQYRRDFE